MRARFMGVKCMNYMSRQKFEIVILIALHIIALSVFSYHSQSMFTVTLATFISYASCQACFLFLVTLRVDDLEDDYGSKYDYPPVLVVVLFYIGILYWLS